MIDQPFFDRWRAKLIANLDPAGVADVDTIRFARVPATVAAVCPFLRFDGEPCEQLITYYLQVGSGAEDDLSYALGACHRHLGHAFDVLFTADRFGLPDPCDEDAVDASLACPPAEPPVPRDDAEQAEHLVTSGFATAADFGTTAIHEGFAAVRGACVTFTPDVAERLRASGVFELAADLGIEIVAADDGSVTLATPRPDGAEEWIAQNRALRCLVDDAYDDTVDPAGYRYRTIADGLPELVDVEPRVYGPARSGSLEVRVRIASTPSERTWDTEVGERHQVCRLFVDRVPQPGDYLDLTFARYRFVRVAGGDPPHDADTVLERVNEPSRN